MTSLLALLIPTFVFGAEISDDFSSRAALDTTSDTAIWNHALGKIHPTLRVMNFRGGFTPKTVDVGEGEHGVFDVTTYAQFSAGGDISGNIIRLDTNIYPELHVTRFHLASGWRLEPVGNAPLVIRSLSDVIIEGEIWCQGNAGSDAVGATPGAGGTGRCGGMSGGDGGAPNASGTDGSNAIAPVTGGGGGNFTGGAAVGGGGGGAFSLTSATGSGANSSVPNGGLGGTNSSDPEFLTAFTVGAGGAGGGGGSGTATAAGAGGGGGGGLVVIHAVRDFDLGTAPTSVNGFIFVSGGAGGSSNVAGGPGGGGGGGGVQVFVGGTINIYNADASGASRAESGPGGTNLSAALGGAGGTGRSWYSSVNYNGVGYYTPAEEPPVSPGNVEFDPSAQYVTTNTVDLEQTLAIVNSLTLTPSSSDFTFEAAGSNDAFIADDTGWTTDLAALSNKRYLRLRIGIATSDVNNPTMIDSAVLAYTETERELFELQAAGCARVDSGNPQRALPLFALLAFLMLLKLKAELKARVRR